jgi:hypothetical protein
MADFRLVIEFFRSHTSELNERFLPASSYESREVTRLETF